MSNYRRSRIGQVYFFTVFTNRRAPILTTELGRRFLNEAIHDVRDELPFENVAFVLLPDHLHTVWELPTGETDLFDSLEENQSNIHKEVTESELVLVRLSQNVILG